MLTQLHIRNFAIIDELELALRSGMTVLTGETGAGKSILLGALGLLLGDRAETAVIRPGADRAEVSAIFDVRDNEEIRTLLDEQALETEGGELMIRRVVNRDGPSRAFVNGAPATAQLLKALGERLVDIHGQHAHQSLMKRDVQRALLDACAGHNDLLAEVRRGWEDWQRASKALAELCDDGQDRDARQELLQYQVRELEELAPGAEEFDALEEEYKRLANGSRLLETGRSLLELLHENDESVHSRLGYAQRELSELQRLDPALDQVADLLGGALIQLDEGANELRGYLERLDPDPERLNAAEQRLDALHGAARKHRVRPQELARHLRQLQEQLQRLLHGQEAVEALEREQNEALERYRAAAARLHQSRIKAAAAMGAAVSKQLQRLGMPEGGLSVEVRESDADTPQVDGADQVEFLISLNPGQPPQPLRKVASGGELSRISLAIQVVCREDRRIPTFIFDEVDAGIGGGVAEIVGNLLHGLTATHQVFCVTHLPQVAAQGDHHLLVEKSSKRDSTRTRVIPLDAKRRVEEIARMLGGRKITEKTREHAHEMLNDASQGVTSH
ncbi:MAG: DNA repair protein RecN [Gammaproteobacteria bacterium]|jgi:DNA repair protein RecN (Recombination protein N)